MSKFCGNCGFKLEDDARVCGKCGNTLGNVKQSPDNSKEKIVKIGIAALVVVLVIALVCIIIAISNSGDIYGTWEVSERSINENLDGYPEDDFVIYENGSFTCDGFSGTYSMNDDTITFSFSIFGVYTYQYYEYNVSGNTLMLRNIDDEDEPKIYYERVS